jgi:hypothetical protein
VVPSQALSHNIKKPPTNRLGDFLFEKQSKTTRSILFLG